MLEPSAGPWKLRVDRSQLWIEGAPGANGPTMIALVEPPWAENRHKMSAPRERAMPNALVLAAAFEMYEALKVLIPALQDAGQGAWRFTGPLTKGLDAIAKAERGEQGVAR